MQDQKFTVLGPLMGGKGSQAFLGCVQDDRGGTGRGQVRPVVMVFLPDDVERNPDLLAQIIEETKVASQIDHVNVIGVWGVARLDEGTARIVEFADAESLATVYERLQETSRPLPIPIAAAVVANACMGAHYAHELGRMEEGKPMIHGGIRPGTLLVSFQGMAKVTGYGAATLAEWLRKDRGEEVAVRDPYTAPEQIFGGRTAATEQTDVYALGAVLFEAIMGRPPIDESAGISDVLIRDDVTPDQLEGAEPVLADIVMRAMRRKATDRYPSALDMRQALLDSGLCASEAEVRGFMEDLFPPDFPTRVARLNLLASARKKREVTRPQFKPPPVSGLGRPVSPEEEDASAGAPPRPPSARPAVVDEPPAPAAAAPPTPAPMTDPPAPAYVPPASPATGPGASTGTLTPVPVVAAPPPQQVVYRVPPWLSVVIALVAGAAVALGAVVFLKDDAPPAPVVATPAPTTPVDQPPAAPPSPPDKPEDPPPKRDSTPTSKRDAKRSPPPPPPPKNGTLVIHTDPPVSISIDGKTVGTGKGSLEVKAGKHKVRLKDSSKGIHMTETVRVKGGETKTVTYEIGKGQLLLEAPAGSLVYLDGVKVGTAPLKPYPVYEGSHVVTVKKEVGGPAFTRKFSVRPGDQVSVWVEFRSQPAP